MYVCPKTSQNNCHLSSFVLLSASMDSLKHWSKFIICTLILAEPRQYSIVEELFNTCLIFSSDICECHEWSSRKLQGGKPSDEDKHTMDQLCQRVCLVLVVVLATNIGKSSSSQTQVIIKFIQIEGCIYQQSNCYLALPIYLPFDGGPDPQGAL